MGRVIGRLSLTNLIVISSAPTAFLLVLGYIYKIIFINMSALAALVVFKTLLHAIRKKNKTKPKSMMTDQFDYSNFPELGIVKIVYFVNYIFSQGIIILCLSHITIKLLVGLNYKLTNYRANFEGSIFQIGHNQLQITKPFVFLVGFPHLFSIP